MVAVSDRRGSELSRSGLEPLPVLATKSWQMGKQTEHLVEAKCEDRLGHRKLNIVASQHSLRRMLCWKQAEVPGRLSKCPAWRVF